MPAPIPWPCLSGEVVEQVLASYICKRHPDAVHVRPSRGDNGIDVFRIVAPGHVSVYQIKKFALNLTAGQKRQIEKSFSALMAYATERHLVVDEWSLVMPLDPTPENLEWFQTLTANKCGKASWVGLAHIEGWIAENPEIADYYVQHGEEATGALIARAIAAGRAVDVRDPQAFKEQLEAIRQKLAAQHPHFDFRLSLLPDAITEESLGTFMTSDTRADVLVTQWLPVGNGTIRVDVLPKHAAALDLNPPEADLTFAPETPEQAQQLQDFFDYGTPFTAMPVEATMPLDLPGLDGSQPMVGRASVRETHRDQRHAAHLEDELGHRLPLHQTFSRGGAKGVEWGAADALGFVTLTVRQRRHRLEGEPASSINCRFAPSRLTGASPRDVERTLRFLSGPHEEVYLIIDGSRRKSTRGWMEQAAKVSDGLLPLVEALLTLDTVSSSPVLFPDLDNLSREQLEQIIRSAAEVRRIPQVHQWDGQRLQLPAENLGPSDGSVLVSLVRRHELQVNEARYDLGLAQTVWVGELIQQEEVHVATAAGYEPCAVTVGIDLTERNLALAGKPHFEPAPTPESWSRELERLRGPQSSGAPVEEASNASGDIEPGQQSE